MNHPVIPLHVRRAAQPQPPADPYGRVFPYLRLSITDVCNFRCSYCLPDGYQKHERDFLSVDEIETLVRGFARFGVHKVRLTGGEPTVRRDLVDIAQRLRGIAGITKLALTTNGYALEQNAAAWHTAGIDALNVSVDSLDAPRFAHITGHDLLPQVLAGLQAAIDAGFQRIKLNTVLLKGENDDELERWLDWLPQQPAYDLRFIELMQTGDNLDYFRRHHLPASTIAEALLARGWAPLPRAADAGPAVEYGHPDYRNRIGLIAPYSKNFCTTCNRLRVTARGDLRLCLFGGDSHALRPLLAGADAPQAVAERVAHLLAGKAASHQLQQGQVGLTPHLASLGG